jgi:hypothetical protein
VALVAESEANLVDPPVSLLDYDTMIGVMPEALRFDVAGRLPHGLDESIYPKPGRPLESPIGENGVPLPEILTSVGGNATKRCRGVGFIKNVLIMRLPGARRQPEADPIGGDRAQELPAGAGVPL